MRTRWLYRPDQYAAAKSGLLGMTMSAAKEWSKFGVRTNSAVSALSRHP